MSTSRREREREKDKFVPRATRLSFIGFYDTLKPELLVNMEQPHTVVKRGMALIRCVQDQFIGFSDAGADIPDPAFLGYDFDLTITYPPGPTCSHRSPDLLTGPIALTNTDIYPPFDGDTISMMLEFTHHYCESTVWPDVPSFPETQLNSIWTYLSHIENKFVQEHYPLASDCFLPNELILGILISQSLEPNDVCNIGVLFLYDGQANLRQGELCSQVVKELGSAPARCVPSELVWFPLG